MTAQDPRSAATFEDILSSAVDRQMSEQRALQDTLTSILDAVGELRREAEGASAAELAEVRQTLQDLRAQLSDRPDASSSEEFTRALEALPAVREDLKTLSDRVGLDSIEERIRSLPESLFRGVKDAIIPQLRTTELLEEIRDLRTDLTQLPKPRFPEGLGEQFEDLRSSVETATQDVQALAQAMLDLNSGLRDWANAIEDRVAGLAAALSEGLGDLATAQREALDGLSDAVSATSKEIREDVGGMVGEAIDPLVGRLDSVEEHLVEAGELSRYLQDQANDLDKVIGGLGEVPERLEGVVAQALRRALTVRAGLAREAEKALDRTVGPIEDHVERLVASLEGVSEAFSDERLTDDVRKINLRQVEMSERLDALQESFLTQLEDLEIERRERDAALAEAIDRAARGLEPKAAESVERSGSGKKGASRGSNGSSKSSTQGKASSGKKKSSSSSKTSSSKKSGPSKRSTSKKPSTKKSSSSTKTSSSKGKSSSGSGSRKSSSGGSKAAKRPSSKGSSKGSSGSKGRSKSSGGSSGRSRSSRSSSGGSPASDKRGFRGQDYIPL